MEARRRGRPARRAGYDASGERHHRNIQSGGARAAVFGISDGLVTNVSLILGVAGAHAGGGIVRLSGLAGLIAGAFSMGAGELVSMQAQRELLERELEVERHALEQTPAAERGELVAIYERRGLTPALARQVADLMMRDPQIALETHAREELGIDPTSLGSPLLAAASSFATFALGALLPLIPWLLTHGNGALVASIAIGAAAAISVGVTLGVLTGRSVVRSAARQLLVAAVAAAVTYGVGRAVGASV
ncbi:MAG: VIT1/CCC1 transporter family protein [Acidimicrobiales bacterium]